jgi:uncharacterized membrane protein YkgB
MQSKILEWDYKFINLIKKIGLPFARLSLFVVYFWFGILKIIQVSAANPLVEALLKKTLPFVGFSQFVIFIFSLFEMLIGTLFLFPKMDRIVLPLFAIHMLTTFLPLVFLPQIAWQQAFVPSLEGQYIIKNLVLIALAMVIASNLKPMTDAAK